MGVAIGVAFPQAATAENDAALSLILNCYTCHGTDGVSPGHMPSINGKSSAYLLEQLRGFKDDSKQNTIMGRISRGYSDAQLEVIANYLGAEP